MYTNYAYGVKNQTGTPSGNYNLFVTGTNDYTGSTGFMIKNDITLPGPNKKGTRIFQDSTDNAFLDFRTTATDGAKSLAFRLQDDSAPSSVSNMLTLNKDTVSDSSVYGASVSGRVKASQFYINQPDVRAPLTAGIYLGQNNATTGYFNINKGTGSGGFNFQTFNADGTTNKTNLSLKGSGSVQIPYYSTVTTDSQDSETTAMVAFDATGNLVRSYNQNQRFRGVETRLNNLEGTVLASVPVKVNEIIGRLNTLKIWNTKIAGLSLSAPPAPYNPSPVTATEAVQVQLALSVTLTTAQDPVWQTSFINAVAANLGISPSRIVISSVSLTATVYSASFNHLTLQRAYKGAADGAVYVNVVVNPDPAGASPITPALAASTIIAKAQDPSSDLAVAVASTGAAVDTRYVPAQKPSATVTPAPTTPVPTTPVPTTPAPTTPAPTTPAPTTPAPTTPAPTTPAPTTPAPTTPAPSYPSGLVSRLSFDNTLSDSFGVLGAPTVTGTTTYSSGKVGASSIDFTANSGLSGSAANQLIYGGLGLNMNGTFSISLWIKPAAMAYTQLILSMCPIVASYAFEMGILTDGTIATGYSGVADLVFSSPGVIKVGIWHKVTMTFSSGALSLYVNGTQVGSQAPSIGNNALNYLFLGGGHQGALNYKGYVDDVCIYNRALTATEVQTYDTPLILYDFTNFTFTPNGKTGATGPTALTYSTVTYPWISSYLTLAAGIQRWIVPKTGTYNLIAAGARGGSTYEKYPGGWGIVVSTSVSLTKNDAIYILVGQRGGDAMTYASQQGGAGGGTFIVKYLGGATVSASYPIVEKTSYQILLIAGGGGGGCGLVNSQDGLATTTGGVVPSAALAGGSTLWSTPATNGGGGGNGNLNPDPQSKPNGSSAGGGGFSGDGTNHSVTHGTQPQGTSRQGYSFISGGVGGTGTAETGYDNYGGFGGGAGSGANSSWGVGGAGGYSGGAGGGGNQQPWVWTNTGAGGGGSYDINGTNNNATFIKTNGNDGYAIIYSSSYSSPISIVEPNNLQYYYRFDSSDVSGVNVSNCATISTDNDRGILVNGASISTSDKVKGTASLSVSSASSQCMTLPPFKMHSSYTGFSVSLWAKKNGSAAGNSVIFAMSQINVLNTQDKAQPQYIYHIAIDGSNLAFYYYNNQSTVGTSFWTGVSPTVWNHIVWTVSSSGVSTFYVNNVDKTSAMNSNYWPAHSQSNLPTTTYNNGVYPYVRLGCDHKNAQYFNGNIDDFRMYTSPLTATQISNLYNSS